MKQGSALGRPGTLWCSCPLLSHDPTALEFLKRDPVRSDPIGHLLTKTEGTLPVKGHKTWLQGVLANLVLAGLKPRSHKEEADPCRCCSPCCKFMGPLYQFPSWASSSSLSQVRPSRCQFPGKHVLIESHSPVFTC